MKHMISFILIGVALLLPKYFYDLYENYKISHIGGSWIRSAKNVRYTNNTLCADLRKSKFRTNDYNSIYDMYGYDRSCIEIPSDRKVKLVNKGGKFEIDQSTSGPDYSHTITYPRGSWVHSACWITYFPNSVCAYFLVDSTITYVKFYGKNLTTTHYNEDCIEYEENDYLIDDSGKFGIILKH